MGQVASQIARFLWRLAALAIDPAAVYIIAHSPRDSYFLVPLSAQCSRFREHQIAVQRDLLLAGSSSNFRAAHFDQPEILAGRRLYSAALRNQSFVALPLIASTSRRSRKTWPLCEEKSKTAGITTVRCSSPPKTFDFFFGDNFTHSSAKELLSRPRRIRR